MPLPILIGFIFSKPIKSLRMFYKHVINKNVWFYVITGVKSRHTSPKSPYNSPVWVFDVSFLSLILLKHSVKTYTAIPSVITSMWMATVLFLLVLLVRNTTIH